ncbi:MAG: PIG-L family deacetylase [Verrucomicrobia bacterium]|nr:PIG-L family deacetylase [Verrucomicrobiota bacterium]
MRYLILSTLIAAMLAVEANAAPITNGDWDSTLNLNWSSDKAEDTQADLNGWFSSARDALSNGAYVEPITGYGSGAVAALKATSISNYFQQTLAGVDAGIGEITVNYDGGIRYHSSYSTTARNIHLRVSLWDATDNTELAGVDTVTAFSSSATSLSTCSHVLSYDATGLAGHSLAVRFENTTPQATGYDNGSTVLFDDVAIEALLPSDTPPTITTPPQSATAVEAGTHTFLVLANGSQPMVYQWRKGGTNLVNEISSSLTLTNLTLSDEGDYSVVVNNSFGSATSSVATLTVVEFDSDNDGLPTDWEIANGLDPLDDGSVDPDNGARGDPDGDGLPNDEEYFMNSDPQVNESGKPWQARPEKAQLMIISAHPDDESIFFGGAYPYYTQVRQLPTVGISMTSGDWNRVPEIREAEFRNATWAYGLRNQPIFPRFKDYPTSTLDQTWDVWADGILGDGSDVEAGKEKATRALAKWIRRYQPEVVLTHDFDGEYGHKNHQATAWATTWAVDMAADPAVDLDELPVWQVKKLYIHNYDPASPNGTDPLFHEHWQDISIDSDGNGTPDQTPIDTANVGSDFHVSQGRPNVSTCYASGETSSSWEPYPCEWWGLYSSTVGDDTVEPDFTGPNANNNPVTYSGWALGDFFEHLTTYPDSDYDLLSDPWELAHFADLAAADPNADDDGDGHDNNYEFITGLDPQVPDQLDMQLASATHTVEFTLPDATGPGYEGLARRYQLKYSADLADWNTVVAEGISDGTPITYPIPDGLQKGFYRLYITLE